MLKIKRQYKLYISTAIFASFVALITCVQLDRLPSEPAATYLVNAIFLSTAMNDITIIMQISIIMFIQVIPLIDIFKKDFSIELWYCITRYKSKMIWYLKKTSTVFSASIFSAFVYSMTCLCVFFIRKTVDWQMLYENRQLIGYIFLFKFFYVLLFALILNVVSIRLSAKAALPIGAAMSVIYSIVFTLEQKLGCSFSLIPLTRVLIFNHVDVNKLIPEDYLEYVFANMSLSSTVVYFLLLISATFLIGALITQKSQFGLMRES